MSPPASSPSENKLPGVSQPDFHPARCVTASRFETAASVPPIYQTAAFDVADLTQLASVQEGRQAGYLYTRDQNPNHSALAGSVARLEGTEAGAVFSSGMAAISSVFLTLGQSGGHVILSSALYGRTVQLAASMQKQFGLELTFVDPGTPAAFAEALRPETRFVLVETISNPLLHICDLAAISQQLGAIPLVVDATFTPPVLLQSCQHGASIVVHSASKYLNGHGDLILGVAAGSAEMMQRLLETASIFGANANPFESWLCQRGLRTLGLRMDQICATTWQLASFLESHPAIRKVHFPLLPSHDCFNVASRLYPRGTGGIVSFELHGTGGEVVNELMRHCPEIPFSPSLADARTTMSYPAGTSHRTLSSKQRRDMGITDELVRLSVGLEPFELLRGELQLALDRLLAGRSNGIGIPSGGANE